MNAKKITLSIFTFLILQDLLETFTHFCFKKSTLAGTSLSITDPHQIFLLLKSISGSPFLWLGFLSVGVIFVIWSTVLSKIDLSVAVPVCSFSYITIPIVSLLYFHEKISLLRWAGIALILAGIVVVSVSSAEKKDTRT
jgi:drug/metabolite transporter (DMT)-like permease